MAGLVVYCRSCGREVPSADVRDGLCLECRLDRDLSDLREEHLRLWRKRERYQGRGANAESVSRQLERVEGRMTSRILAVVTDRERAAELLSKQLERARASRFEIRRA
jgi:hypothetical protein